MPEIGAKGRIRKVDSRPELFSSADFIWPVLSRSSQEISFAQSHGRIPITLVLAVYDRIEFIVLPPRIKGAPTCTQCESLSTPRKRMQLKRKVWLPGLDSN